jgi:hypothetical protein
MYDKHLLCFFFVLPHFYNFYSYIFHVLFFVNFSFFPFSFVHKSCDLWVPFFCPWFTCQSASTFALLMRVMTINIWHCENASTNPRFSGSWFWSKNGNFISGETKHGCKNNYSQKIVFAYYNPNPVICRFQSLLFPEAHKTLQ